LSVKRPGTIEARRLILPALVLATLSATADAGEILRLNSKNWRTSQLAGKEIDAIHGDWLIRNENVIAVIADTLPTRNANMRVEAIGGTLIDFMRRDVPNDQLTLWDTRPAGFELSHAEVISATGALVELVCSSEPAPGEAWIAVHYRLAQHSDHLEVETVLHAPEDGAAVLQTVDGVIAGGTFNAFTTSDGRLTWVEDRWFDAAYGVSPQADGRVIGQLAGAKHAPGAFIYSWQGKANLRAPAAGEAAFTRWIYCAASSLDLRTMAARDAGRPGRRIDLHVHSQGDPVADALCFARSGDQSLGFGRADDAGRVSFNLPPGPATIRVDSAGRPPQSLEIDGDAPVEHSFDLHQPGWIEGRFTDEQGEPLPCGVQIIGRNETATPYFFPTSGDLHVRSTLYTVDGTFRQALLPGLYTAMASRGPEYDVASVDFEAKRGGTTRVTGKLVRSVDTSGWIAADLHGHSSPSGDTYASPLGRIMSLACSGMEFSPRTEHNRIESFRSLLSSTGLTPWLASSPSIELTGDVIRAGHNIAFPLIPVPHTQDGGAPQPDDDPAVQIARLAGWDSNSEKVVILCHPALVRVLYDQDSDGKFDGGFPGLIEHADVIEVPPLERIFDDVVTGKSRVLTWMQLMNQGLRKPGVMSGDQHDNAGGGLARTYIKSSFDDPALLPTRQVVRQLKAGHAMMTSGPFLEARVVSRLPGRARDSIAIPGDEILLQPQARTSLEIRVQCANWYDIDRVQVFRNGRAVPEWNFTRADNPDLFHDEVVRFEHQIDLHLEADAHLIVCAIGENTHMGVELPLVLPRRAEVRPVAVTNPIFVDTDGDGFTPNGDDLGTPLPLTK
jgi:hypothetical protein